MIKAFFFFKIMILFSAFLQQCWKNDERIAERTSVVAFREKRCGMLVIKLKKKGRGLGRVGKSCIFVADKLDGYEWNFAMGG